MTHRILAGASVAAALLTAIGAAGASPARAATEPTATAPLATAPSGASAPAPDPLDRDSPRTTVAGFLEATDAGDHERAGRYLDIAAEPRARRADAARRLRAVLDRQVWIDLDALSGELDGSPDDGLAADLDSLGWLDTPDGPRQVLLQRRERDGAQRWLFSAATVAAAERAYEAHGYDRASAFLPAALVEHQLLHVQLWQWIALLLLVCVAYCTVWIATYLAAAFVAPLLRRTQTAMDERLLQIAVGPTRLLLGVAMFSAGRRPLDLTAAARTVLASTEYVLVVAAAAWAVLRLLNLISAALQDRLLRRGQSEAVNLVAPARRTVKVFVLGLALVAVLDGFGFDVTAILAGLGVGGIAVALAAQKSIENLFGGISLYADRPVRVGDFCRFGETVGTIEDIGLRSTRVRTLERSVVTVPNAEFASLQIENFSRRDRFWYHPTIGLRYETTPDQLRYVLVEVRRMLYSHPKVDPNPARIRFERFGAYALDLEVFAYVLAPDFDAFLEVAEDLNLRIMDIVAAAGSSFAFPSQTAYLESGTGLDAERGRQAEREVAKWRERDTLYLPRFPDDRIAALKGTLEYPPAGSPGRREAGGRDGGARAPRSGRTEERYKS
jgi:MscS family membrane protein